MVSIPQPSLPRPICVLCINSATLLSLEKSVNCKRFAAVVLLLSMHCLSPYHSPPPPRFSFIYFFKLHQILLAVFKQKKSPFFLPVWSTFCTHAFFKFCITESFFYSVNQTLEHFLFSLFYNKHTITFILFSTIHLFTLKYLCTYILLILVSTVKDYIGTKIKIPYLDKKGIWLLHFIPNLCTGLK